jgi:hypothetical protein
MGWEECHLHEFVLGQRRISDPLFEIEDIENEWEVTLEEAVPAGKRKFEYLYDFGDGWEHVIVVEKILQAEPRVDYPRCTGGARRAPFEDSGGIWGWEEKVALVNGKPKGVDREEYALVREWLGLKRGQKIDTESFDLEQINERMEKSIASSKKARRKWARE